MSNYKHFCPEWDFLAIDADSAEFEACICDIDSDGRGPQFHSGDRVLVIPLGMNATVIKQMKHHDYPESFWGNVELAYDDGATGTSMCWQIKKVEE